MKLLCNIQAATNIHNIEVLVWITNRTLSFTTTCYQRLPPTVCLLSPENHRLPETYSHTMCRKNLKPVFLQDNYRTLCIGYLILTTQITPTFCFDTQITCTWQWPSEKTVYPKFEIYRYFVLHFFIYHSKNLNPDFYKFLCNIDFISPINGHPMTSRNCVQRFWEPPIFLTLPRETQCSQTEYRLNDAIKRYSLYTVVAINQVSEGYE